LKLRQQHSQRMQVASKKMKKMIVTAMPKAPKSRNSSPDLATGIPSTINQIKSMINKAAIRISHPNKSPRQPVHDFFQKLFGFSFIKFIVG
jgi:hypothetical protein